MAGVRFSRFSCNVKFLLSDCRGRFHNLGLSSSPLPPMSPYRILKGPSALPPFICAERTQRPYKEPFRRTRWHRERCNASIFIAFRVARSFSFTNAVHVSDSMNWITHVARVAFRPRHI